MKGLIFTYALTYGGAVASLFNPFVGFLIYVCFAIIKPESLWHWSVPAGNYSRIIAIALLVGWAVHGFGQWDLGRAKAVLFLLVAWWLWAALSALFCENRAVAMSFLETKGKIVLPCVVGLTLIDSWEKLRYLAWTIVLSLGYVAYDLNMSYFGGFNRLHGYGFGGMDNNCMAIALVTGVGLSFFLGLYTRNWIGKLAGFACAALMAHAIFFSFSRGAMLSLIFVGVVTFALIPKRPVYLSLFGLGVVVALMMTGPEVIERFYMAFADKEDRDQSAQNRLDAWETCVRAMEDNPVLGVGPEHFRLTARQYGSHANIEAHSLWFQTGAELGIPGLSFLAAFYALTMWRLWGIRRKWGDAGQVGRFGVPEVTAMVLASLAGFMLAAQFVTLAGLEIPYYVAILGAGALKLESHHTEEAGGAEEPGMAPAEEAQSPSLVA